MLTMRLVLRVTMIIVLVEVVVTRVMSSVGLEWNREQNLTPTLICSPSTHCINTGQSRSVSAPPLELLSPPAPD